MRIWASASLVPTATNPGHIVESRRVLSKLHPMKTAHNDSYTLHGEGIGRWGFVRNLYLPS
jgi:hypothetical protein